jgi:hypothetical protein
MGFFDGPNELDSVDASEAGTDSWNNVIIILALMMVPSLGRPAPWSVGCQAPDS